MKTGKLAVMAGLAFAMCSSKSLAIEDLSLSIHCPDVWLSWPSVQNGETYIVQYRQSLDTNSPWITLTNQMPPDSETNRTLFVHPNQVSCPTGQVFGLSMPGGGGDNSDLASGVVPIASYPSDLRSAVMSGSDYYLAGSPPLPPSRIQTNGVWVTLPTQSSPPTAVLVSERLRARVLASLSQNAANAASESAPTATTSDSGSPQEPGAGGPGPNDGPSSVPSTGFYRVVRNGVHIFGLTNGTTLTGTVELPIEAGYLDGSPLEVVTLSANSSPIQGVFPLSQPFPYPIAFGLDTTRMDNGNYYLQVSGRWRVAHTNTYDPPTVQLDGVNGDVVQVFVTNDICYPNWVTDVGETNMIFKITSLRTNINWRVDVYGETGDFIRAFTNHSDDGLIDFSWNLADTNGNPRTDLTFSSVTTVSDFTRELSVPSTNPPFIKQIDNYPDQGRWIVARADIVPHDFQRYDQWESAINSIASMGEQGGGVLPNIGRNYGEAFVVNVGNTTNWANLLRATTNQVRNFYWNGHGTPDTIEDGEISLASSEIAKFLHNQLPSTNTTRYRFVWLDGCSTALGSWPAAFGMGNRENVPLSSYTARPSAFAGYTQMIFGYGGHTSVSQAACDYRSNLAFYWSLANNGIRDAFDNAQNDSGFSEAAYLKLYGLWDLRWTAYNQKTDWPP